MPVELRLRIGEEAHIYSKSTYMLTNWLIDVGGISKALYFGGMVISHFVALRAYKAALIGDVLMVQEDKETLFLRSESMFDDGDEKVSKTARRRRSIRKEDKSKSLWKKIKDEGKVTREHTLDLLNTLIGRKRMKSTTWQVIKDMIFACMPCKTRFLSNKYL